MEIESVFQAVIYLVRLVEVLERTFCRLGNRQRDHLDLFNDFFEIFDINKWIEQNGGWGVSCHSLCISCYYSHSYSCAFFSPFCFYCILTERSSSR